MRDKGKIMKHAEKYNTDNGKGSFAVSFHTDPDTEFNIKENTTNGDVIRIGNLRIFLSREDLEMLADSIAAYTGRVYADTVGVFLDEAECVLVSNDLQRRMELDEGVMYTHKNTFGRLRKISAR